MIKLSVVIPCYNEAKNIPLILNRFKEVIKRDDIEVIMVNNGSVDNSKQVFDDLLPLYPFVRYILIEKNEGYGNGIIAGLKVARGDYLGWTHADMQTDPNDVVKVLNIIETKSNNAKNIFIKGTRKGRPISDKIFTLGMSAFETLLLGHKFWDINAQPSIFHKEFFQSWKQPPKDFSLDLYAYFYAKKMNLSIIRFDVEFPERIHGTSNWNIDLKSKYKFIKRTTDFSFHLKKCMKVKK